MVRRMVSSHDFSLFQQTATGTQRPARRTCRHRRHPFDLQGFAEIGVGRATPQTASISRLTSITLRSLNPIWCPDAGQRRRSRDAPGRR